MDIVDININTCKYVSRRKLRHVNYVKNISHWINSNDLYINCKSINIVHKYKKFLNQRNINVIKKCIEYKINIIPVLYQINNSVVELLVKHLFNYENYYMFKIIYEYIKINHINYAIYACDNGYINIVKYLHKKVKLTKKDFQSYNREPCQLSYYNGNTGVVKYLHKKIGLEKTYFQSDDNHLCRWTCYYGHYDVVKYLHKKIELTKQDFQSNDNFACTWACENGYINVVKYLHKEIGLTKDDFQSNGNSAHQWACHNN